MNGLNYLKSEIVIVGLGYVGLPLALRLASAFNVIGYDISVERIDKLKAGSDETKEVKRSELINTKKLRFTSKINQIKNKKIYIVAVPTPVDKKNRPDLSYIQNACRIVGNSMASGAIVIFESTVYPGVTEEFCGPIIEKESGLQFNKDFYLGYSPERINPGDKEHTVEKITKIVSASDPEILKIIGKIYSTIIDKEVFYAKSIKIAETAKAIENAQRDINIAFINEIAILCQRLNVSVYDVLAAAETKWNFLPFQPGLVGGHCIGVDPYYLAHVAKELNYDTKVILAGRDLNDQMVNFLFDIISKKISSKDRILQLGISFKENIADIRNSKAAELAKKFINNGNTIDIYDPLANAKEMKKIYGIKSKIPEGKYECIIVTVPHIKIIKYLEKDLAKLAKKSTILFDIKGIYRDKNIRKNMNYWSF